VIFIVFWDQFRSGEKSFAAMLALIGCNYLFKVMVAAVDTVPFYIGTSILRRYLHLPATPPQRASRPAS